MTAKSGDMSGTGSGPGSVLAAGAGVDAAKGEIHDIAVAG